jgi:predicted ABC-type ATPase
MFAGPNGSGKSTIKSVLPPELLGVYVNPDEIEKEIREHDFLNVAAYGVETTAEEILPFFTNSTLLLKSGMDEDAENLRFTDGKLSFFEVLVNAYFASVAADFLRQKLLEKQVSFSFETVMSAPDKVGCWKKRRRWVTGPISITSPPKIRRSMRPA